MKTPNPIAIRILYFKLTLLLEALDTITYGNYVIQGCGAHATDVTNLLNQAHAYMQDVIDAFDAGTPLNLKAYIQWFHAVNPDMLGPMLKGVINSHLVPLGMGSAKPAIFCLSAPFPGMTYYYDICKSHGKVRTMYIPMTGAVGLCPDFFSMPLLPTSAMCQKVVPGPSPATTMLAGDAITRTQLNGLIHEIIHAHLGPSALRPGILDGNKCASLPPKNAIRNSENYNYYIASTSSLSLQLELIVRPNVFCLGPDVIANCTDFPPTPIRLDG